MFCCVILFCLFFHLKSLVTIAPLKQLIVSLRMEEQFIRNVTPEKYVFISDSDVVPSKQQLKTAILDNKESSTGFLM